MISKQTIKDIIWSTFVQYFGKTLQIGLGIIAVKLVTNAIGVEEYGFYGRMAEYALFFSVAANLGIFGNVVRKMSQTPNDGKLFINAFILRITTAFAFLISGFLYSWLFIPEKGFALGVMFFTASLFFDYITSVCDGMLQANYLMGRAVSALLLGRVTNLAIVLALIYFSAQSAPLYFLAPLGASLITASLSLLFVRLKIKFVWELNWPLIKDIFWTALPFGIINIINNLYFRFLPSYFAGKVLSDTQFGSYSISLHIATTVSLFSTYLMFSTLPAFKRSLHDKHFRRAKAIYKAVIKGLIALSLLTVFVGSWLAPLAIRLVSSADYFLPEFWFLLPLMLVLAAVSFFYDLILITLFAFEKETWLLKREFLALAAGAAILLLSFLPETTTIKTALILLSAIYAESLMVGLGLYKIQKEFRRLKEIKGSR
jgi:O-antigen/teichoic acid export membrane protein